MEDAVSPNPFARIRNERYECAQSISAFLLLRYICDADPPTEAKEEGAPEGLRRGRIERGYYDDLVRVINGDDHFNRIGDFVREAVLERSTGGRKTPARDGFSPSTLTLTK